MLKTKGSISEGLVILEQALQDEKINELLDDHVKLEL
jgi:translation initiation factor 2 beta subunit (eIF-2beta)/eIF-5